MEVGKKQGGSVIFILLGRAEPVGFLYLLYPNSLQSKPPIQADTAW